MQNNQNNNSQKIRYDLGVIADLINPNSKVLDIGCGDGELLNFLKNTKNIDARGLEISHKQVSKALIRGLSVIHGNAENDLSIYPDNSFDYAVLSQTIQATQNPPKILLEMLRIANYAIISLPNFAHIRNRFDLMFKGQMPVNKNMPYQWYETPNIHFCSILDFEKLCFKLDLNIQKKVFLTSNHRFCGIFKNEFFSNLFAKYGIFLITKNEFKASCQEEFAFKSIFNLGYKTAISNYDYKNKIND